jgi:hypothetical protein
VIECWESRESMQMNSRQTGLEPGTRAHEQVRALQKVQQFSMGQITLFYFGGSKGI